MHTIRKIHRQFMKKHDKFRQFNWYHMPPTLHKILIHGSKIINNFDMPIGILSEEAQEATNKDGSKSTVPENEVHHLLENELECDSENSSTSDDQLTTIIYNLLFICVTALYCLN
jgi:hypothetical protein